MEEYASSRLMSVWVTATTDPTNSVTTAAPATAGRQSQCMPRNGTYRNRISAPNAAVTVALAISAVTAVGAPWYTSGFQEWNGATPALNSSPISSIARPRKNNRSLWVPSAVAAEIARRFTELAYP